jgi:hypothetical protein
MVFFSISNKGIHATNANKLKLPVNGNDKTIKIPERMLSRYRHFLDR